MREVKEHQHGTITGYSYGCKCEPCKEANNAIKRSAYRISSTPEKRKQYRDAFRAKQGLPPTKPVDIDAGKLAVAIARKPDYVFHGHSRSIEDTRKQMLKQRTS